MIVLSFTIKISIRIACIESNSVIILLMTDFKNNMGDKAL